MRYKKQAVESGELLTYVSRTPLGSILHHGLWKNSSGAHRARRFRSYFCFVYTVGGETVYEDDLIGKRSLVAGDLLLIHPGVTHRYGNGDTGGWDEYFILFESPLFDLWKERKLLDARKPIVHLEPVPYWQQRLTSCAGVAEQTDLASSLKRIVDLQAFVTEVIGVQSASDRNNARPWLAQACRRLESNLAEPIDWNKFACSLGLSADTFRKLFTRAMGVSPHRYRSARIIDRACQLSVEQHKLGKEIAIELGFATEQHFSRRFKEITGLTLRQFRQQWTAAHPFLIQNR